MASDSGGLRAQLEAAQRKAEAQAAALAGIRTEYPDVPSAMPGDAEQLDTLNASLAGAQSPDEVLSIAQGGSPNTALGESDLTTSGGRRAMLKPARIGINDRMAGFNQGTGISGPQDSTAQASASAAQGGAASSSQDARDMQGYGVRSHLATGLGNIENFGPSQGYMPGGKKTEVGQRLGRQGPGVLDKYRARLAAMRRASGAG